MTNYPMQSLNGLVVAKPNRKNPTSDFDLTPRQFRRNINASGLQDVQLKNGLRNRIATGLRINYRGAGYLHAAQPTIPGQTRGDSAGFHKRGPSPLNIQAMFANGPGAQPQNPGGPAKIAAPSYINPMGG